MPQQPLNVAIRNLSLVFRPHMARFVRFRPHQTPLIVLYAHNSLAWNIDGSRWGTLETKITVPGRILDGKKSPIRDDAHVVVTIRHKDTISRLNNLRKDMLNRVRG